MRYIPARLVIGLIVMGSALVPLSAQSNARIDELLAQPTATLGHTAYLVLSAAGRIEEDLSVGSAVREAQALGMIAEGATASDIVTFGQFSHLLMESFAVRGGVLYRLFPGPRYAAREVVFHKWSRSDRSPREELSGEEVMRILSVYVNKEANS